MIISINKQLTSIGQNYKSKPISIAKLRNLTKLVIDDESHESKDAVYTVIKIDIKGNKETKYITFNDIVYTIFSAVAFGSSKTLLINNIVIHQGHNSIDKIEEAMKGLKAT